MNNNEIPHECRCEVCHREMAVNHEKLKELCRKIEPWASNAACNSQDFRSGAAYSALREMRSIIYAN